MKILRNLGSAALGAVCLLGLGSQLNAIPLGFNDDIDNRIIGFVVSGEPASALDEGVYISNLVAQAVSSGPTVIDGHTYTRTDNVFDSLPEVTADGSEKDETGGNTGIDVTGFEYLIGKYDGPSGGSAVWYVGDLEGEVDIPQDSSPWKVTKGKGGEGYGLSHWSLYNSSTTNVPDGGATVLLLGAALTGFSLLRRKSGKD